MQIRVYYEDTDVGGVVYHSNYLNFCERARSDAFFKNSISPILENGHFVAKKLVANYISSAKLGDILEVKSNLIEMKNASFSINQTIFKNNTKIFDMKITLAYIDFNGKAQRIDKNTKELIISLFN